VVKAFTGGVGPNAQIKALLVPANNPGRLYVGGAFTQWGGQSYPYLVAIDPDTATPDPGFVVGTGFDSWVHSLLEAPGHPDHLYVGGEFSTYQGTARSRIVRLDEYGAADVGFAGAGAGSGGVQEMAPADDGTNDIYLAGHFWTYDGVASRGFARATETGAKSSVAFEAFDNVMLDVTTWSDAGSTYVYVGGHSATYGANSSQRLARVDGSNGAFDTTFDVGTGFDGPGTPGGGFGGPVQLVVPLANGNVWVGGWFAEYDGTPTAYLVQLDRDGNAVVTF
jgi:hypothetical protein